MTRYVRFGPSRSPERFLLTEFGNTDGGVDAAKARGSRKLETFDSRGKAYKLELTSGDLAVLAMFLNAAPGAVFSNSNIVDAVKTARSIPNRSSKDQAEPNLDQIARRVVGRLRRCFVESKSAKLRKKVSHFNERRHLLGSPDDPILTEQGNGYIFMYVVADPSESVRLEPKSRRPYQAKDRAPLRNLSSLEAAQCAVMAPDFRLDADSLRKLIQLEEEGWTLSHDSGYYSSLIMGFALLKSGPTVSLRNRSRFNNLMRLARRPVAESMAAKWIAGRAHLAWTSILVDPMQKLKEKEEAYELFAGIDAVSSDHLRMPLLLPGASQEYEADELEHIDRAFANDPLVRKIVIPHRYIGSSAVILAEHLGLDGKQYLEDSIRHCKEVEKHHSADSAPRLNADLLQIGTRTILQAATSRRSGHASLIQTTSRLIERITTAAGIGLISKHKEHEWIANCHACSAVAKASGREYVEHIDDLICEVGFLTQGLGQIPDFLRIDPIYRLAFDAKTLGQLDDVLTQLQRRDGGPSGGNSSM